MTMSFSFTFTFPGVLNAWGFRGGETAVRA